MSLWTKLFGEPDKYEFDRTVPLRGPISGIAVDGAVYLCRAKERAYMLAECSKYRIDYNAWTKASRIVHI